MKIPLSLRPLVFSQLALTSIAGAFDSDLDGLDDSVETGTGTFVSATNTGTDAFLPDTDGDGLKDGEEVNSYHTSPVKADSDSDGLSDSKEVELGVYRTFTAVTKRLFWEQARLDAIQSGGRLAILPTAQAYAQAVAQARSAGYTDYMWIGLRDTGSNSWKWLDETTLGYTSKWGSNYPGSGNNDFAFVGTATSNVMYSTPASTDLPAYMLEKSPLDPLNPDTDGDGLWDGAEVNTYKSNPTLTDSDGDELSDFIEVTEHQTNPNATDTDGDGLSDFRELSSTGTSTDPKNPDMDEDGASDGLEVDTMHSNPKDSDTDNDGYLDGFEYYSGYSASSAISKPAALLKAHPAIELELITQIGKRYRLQTSDDLGSWIDTEIEVTGTGGSVRQIFRPASVPAKRYWRFVEMP